MRNLFRRFAAQVSQAMGSPWAFVISLILIVSWAISGPVFGYSDTWQLVINTGTTIVTFLMVFLIQNTQNRDARALQLKLDELIRAVKGARSMFIDVESLGDEDLDQLEKQFSEMQERVARAKKERPSK